MGKFKCKCGGEIVNQKCAKCNTQFEPIIDDGPTGNFVPKKIIKEEQTINSYI